MLDLHEARTMDDVENARREIDIARMVSEKLKSVYPGYIWHVGVRGVSTGNLGMVTICCSTLALDLGYNLYVSTILSDPELKCVVKAGGTILEAVGVSRERMSETQVLGLDRVGDRVVFDPNALVTGAVDAPRFIRDHWNRKRGG